VLKMTKSSTTKIVTTHKAKKRKSKSSQKPDKSTKTEALVVSKTDKNIVRKTHEKDPLSKAQSDAQKAWKWTRKKRKAARLIIKGWGDFKVAKALEVHRNTIANWRATPEFWSFVMAEAREYVKRTRFKRVHETGAIANQLATQAKKRLAAINKRGDGLLHSNEINAAQMFLREYREYRDRESADFGDNVKRIEGILHVGVSDSSSGRGYAIGDKGAQSFKEFVEAHSEKLPERLIEGTTQEEALVGITRELLRETPILDDLYDEDETAAKVEQQNESV
jgi:hypothetical protein